jgi:hypothetical protein
MRLMYLWICALGDGVTELEELAADALGAPQPVLGGHEPDEQDNVGRDARLCGRLSPGAPPPKQAKYVAMTPEQGLQFHEDQCAPPVGKQRSEYHQGEAVPSSEEWLSDMSCGDEELLTKEGILGEELLLGAREIRDEPTARASGSAGFGRESSLNKPPTDTA